MTRAPEICIEVVSPSNSVKELEEKKTAYLAAGAEEVWIVYPHSKRCEFYGRQGLLQRSAHAVVKGRITTYRNSVFGFSQSAQAQEYRVTLGASVTFKDQVKNRQLWSEPEMVKTANYYVVDTPGDSARTELDGRKRAIAKLAEEIVTRSVEGW